MADYWERWWAWRKMEGSTDLGFLVIHVELAT
ncbi:hypothetical protein COLO4_33409 [Corchorus olitorius]|uniref:Uncharacterized protein n=1 Tax=Corchorus olitorius TaxID=93759 RepID=A0A1R3GTX7_9ROSI|nr:hypothetical protein COLO4_33409 [Corchorus olitorius]